ncbi:MAG: hypothetical protein ACRERS_04600, partial [Methylococcales bacterium]
MTSPYWGAPHSDSGRPAGSFCEQGSQSPAGRFRDTSKRIEIASDQAASIAAQWHSDLRIEGNEASITIAR